jgi:2-polyprenyl-3-methyl-5-hydroxy-6-metoxy-1,4-benzoquinol methylase
MHDISGWTEFLDSQFFNLFDRSLILRELITQIRRVASSPTMVIEVGCGSGLTSVLLASMGYKVTAADANAQLVKKVKRFEAAFPNLISVQADMFRMGFKDKNFDIAFSQGVLEHYCDDDIIRALLEQKRIAQIVVIDVPNGRGKIGDYGDERSISPLQWRKLIRTSGLVIVNESARSMARWSESFPKLLRWLEDSRMARHFGENSIFVCKEANNV